MTAPEAPPDPVNPKQHAKVIRHFRRARQRQRLAELMPNIAAWIVGLILTTGGVYVISAGYQRWTDNEARLEALEYRAQLLAPVSTVTETPPTASYPAYVTPPPSTLNPRIWQPGTWETAAAAYLQKHAFDDVSSVTPPGRRRGTK